MSNTIFYKENNISNKLLIVHNGIISALDLKEKMTVGRNTYDNFVDIDLYENFVSRSHGEFLCNSEGCYYTDTNKSNGTYYNGRKLSHNQKQLLKNGDVLHIYNGTPKSYSDTIIMIYMTDCEEKFTSETIFLDEHIDEIRIGRNIDEDVRFGSDAVSENHASFFFAGKGWAISDHNSKNGVYLDNIKITKPLYLQIGDCIRIVNANFIYLGDRIVYQNIEYKPSSYQNTPLQIHIVKRTVKKFFHVKTLLKDIDVTFNSGEMILILGGSGAGKTTLMNAVLGYEKANGKILYNGTDLYKNYHSLKNKISFVPQSDLVRDYDTVYHTLKNAAEMKLPSKTTKKEIEKKLIETLQAFNLEQKENTLVKELSGGERKRLSVAIEYIATPDVFFLDEPDTGIDGPHTKELMQILREIANTGKIIVIISHGANRIADKFDKVLVLAKSKSEQCGQTAYYGTVTEAYSFFDTTDLESIVDKINKEPDFYIQKFKKSEI